MKTTTTKNKQTTNEQKNSSLVIQTAADWNMFLKQQQKQNKKNFSSAKKINAHQCIYLKSWESDLEMLHRLFKNFSFTLSDFGYPI